MTAEMAMAAIRPMTAASTLSLLAALAALAALVAGGGGLSDDGRHAQDVTDESLERYHHLGDDHHHKPRYAYQYSVHDKHTGDIKGAWEHRNGDVTKGGYSLVEPDGHVRVVEYTVTPKGGFQATVKRLPPPPHANPHHHHHHHH